MEYVEGKTLRELLADGLLPTRKLLQIASQIAEGLSKAHAAGIVHRDLKPENIMFTVDGFVVILDFGLAKLVTPLSGADSELATLARDGTSPGVVMGTVGYMSPEQARGQEVDYRTDQFSFGTILYEMATGRRAFQRGSAAQTLTAIIEAEPEPISRLNSRVPPHLRSIAGRCLAKEPGERYDSTRDLAREIKSIDQIPVEMPSEPAALPESPVEKPSRRPVALVGGGVLIVICTLVFGLYLGGMWDKPQEEESPSIESIAVLPLDNISGDPEQEYFADGMTEELTAEISKISALRVISRQSVMQFKGTDQTLPEIAQALNVDALLEGSVRRAGERVRITTQLVQAVRRSTFSNSLMGWKELTKAVNSIF